MAAGFYNRGPQIVAAAVAAAAVADAVAVAAAGLCLYHGVLVFVVAVVVLLFAVADVTQHLLQL